VNAGRKKSRNVRGDNNEIAQVPSGTRVTRSVRIPKQLLDWLDAEAKREHRSTNQHLAYLLEQFRQGKVPDGEGKMALERVYPHIEKPEGEPAHLARVPRVRVAMIVMDYLVHSWSVEEMCRQYPYLKPAEAHAAMAYYYDHRQEIDEEITRETAEAEQSRRQAAPTPFQARMRAEGKL
jgi:uncharacterized protein (DUF433 family)